MAPEALSVARGCWWLPCLLLCISMQRSLISCTEPRFFTSSFTQRFYKTEEKELKKRCWLNDTQQPTRASQPSPPISFRGPARPALPILPLLSLPRTHHPSVPGRGRRRHREGSRRAPRTSCPVSVYLPRAEGDEPGVLAEGALLDLVYKLGQLGVRPTAVINLLQRKARDSKEEKLEYPPIFCGLQGMPRPDRLREREARPQIHKPTVRRLCPMQISANAGPRAYPRHP